MSYVCYLQTAAVVREALLSLALSRHPTAGATGAGVSAGVGAGGGQAARALLGAWTGALPAAGPQAALPPLTALLHAFAAQPTPAKKVSCISSTVTSPNQ